MTLVLEYGFRITDRLRDILGSRHFFVLAFVMEFLASQTGVEVILGMVFVFQFGYWHQGKVNKF